MAQTIIVKPNQSLLDAILQGCGTMEAAMQFAADINMPVSRIPAVNEILIISDAAISIADPDTLQYLQKGGITIGTLGNIDNTTSYIPEDGGGGYTSEDGGDSFVSE